MSLIQLIKYSFFNFSQLKEARKIGLGKIIGYFFVLVAIFTIPIVFQVFQSFEEIREDGQAIAEKIPAFTIQDGKLTPEASEEGFIYQTDSIIFTFDPEGRRSSEDVSNDIVGNFLSIGLLPESIVIGLPASDMTTSLLGSNQLEISYQDSGLTNLNDEVVKETISYKHLPWWLSLIVFLVCFYPAFLNLVLTLLMSSLFAMIYSRIVRTGYSFLDNLKVLILGLTLPICLSTLILFFVPGFDTTTFILLCSVFIFPQIIKKEKTIS